MEPETINTPAGGDTPSNPVQAPITPASTSVGTTVQQGAPAPTQTPATGGVPEGFVPSYRLREARERYERETNARLSQIEASYQKQLDTVQKQLHALVGVNPQTTNPETESIREQFFSLFPWAKKLEEKSDVLDHLFDRANDFDQQLQHHWESYARQNVDRLYSLASDSIGAPLSEEAKRTLHAAFVGFVSSSPELEARYEKDPSIVDDFWKSIAGGLIDPVRRSVSAGVAQRVPQGLPQDAPSGIPRTTPVQQPANLDERGDLAWQLYNQLKRS